jgi:TolA-binding protein
MTSPRGAAKIFPKLKNESRNNTRRRKCRKNRRSATLFAARGQNFRKIFFNNFLKKMDLQNIAEISGWAIAFFTTAGTAGFFFQKTTIETLKNQRDVFEKDAKIERKKKEEVRKENQSLREKLAKMEGKIEHLERIFENRNPKFESVILNSEKSSENTARMIELFISHDAKTAKMFSEISESLKGLHGFIGDVAQKSDQKFLEGSKMNDQITKTMQKIEKHLSQKK